MYPKLCLSTLPSRLLSILMYLGLHGKVTFNGKPFGPPQASDWDETGRKRPNPNNVVVVGSEISRLFYTQWSCLLGTITPHHPNYKKEASPVFFIQDSDRKSFTFGI